MRFLGTLAIVGVLAMGAGLAPVRAAEDWNDDDYAEKDEINMNVELGPGALVTVNDIAGPVTIETWDGSTAEIHVVRSARNRADLEKKKIVVEHTATGLTVQTQPHHGNDWGRVNVRQRVSLRVPQSVSAHVNDVAGMVKIGAIDGDLHVNDVAGALTVDRVGGASTVNDIAGSVTLTVGQIGSTGLRINDIAGRVDLVIDASANADIDVTDIAGKIDIGVANVSVLGKVDPESFHGKIGSGGPLISISDIAGGVHVHN